MQAVSNKVAKGKIKGTSQHVVLKKVAKGKTKGTPFATPSAQRDNRSRYRL